MKKYIEIFKYSLKQKINFLPDYIFSLISFGIHVFIFNELWDYILQGKNIEGYTKTELVWYIIIAELITYSINNIYKQISDTVKNGEIANMLLKPINYVAYLIADSSSIIIKFAINLIFAAILGGVLAGPIEISSVGIIITFISIIISVFLGILIQIFIGLLSFYTEENRSFWLVIQKLQLLMVFTPIEFYPEIMQKILYVFPTTHMIFSPSKMFVDFTNANILKLIGMQLISIVVMVTIIILMYKKGVKKINVNGG